MQKDEVFGVKQKPMPELKLTLSRKPVKDIIPSLSDKQRKAMLILATRLEEKEWSASELESELYSIARQCGLKSREFFSTIYLILLGKKQGPRLAHILLCFSRESIINRLKEAAKTFSHLQ